MKVISHNRETILLQVSQDEFANIMGSSSWYNSDLTKDKVCTWITRSTEIEISKVYQKYVALSELQEREKVKKAVAQLEVMAAALTNLQFLEKEIDKIINEKDEN